MMQITIGADPELFAFKGSVPVSVHDLLPGSKWSPCKVPLGAIQVDGVAAEYNIEPAATKPDFIKNLTHVRTILEKILYNKDNSLVLRAQPTVHFPKTYFNSLPKEVKALGCEPDYNAYTEKENPKPARKKPVATGAGHVHVGWDSCKQNDLAYVPTVVAIVKELDFVLYRQSSLWDDDKERAELYGRPGAFRFKKYGLEYRVLSNKWTDSKNLMAFIFDATKTVAERTMNGERFASAFEKTSVNYEEFLKMQKLPLVRNYLERRSHAV